MLDLEVHGEQVKLLAEITLTLVLFADASRISLPALHREFAVPLRLLGIGLPLMLRSARTASSESEMSPFASGPDGEVPMDRHQVADAEVSMGRRQ